MCGILATLAQHTDLAPYIAANATRGRDSYGFWTTGRSFHFLEEFYQKPFAGIFANKAALANCRAEPTTEWVKKKTTVDVQPFEVGDWVVVHNGTIANDKELAWQHNFNPPTRIDSWVIAALLDKFDDFPLVINKLRGSYAICAVNKREPDVIHFAMNYRPLYLHDELTLSSVQLDKRDMLLEPYSVGILTQDGIQIWPLRDKPSRSKALAVCSGGLDSTVAATALLRVGMEVELLHFSYGCRATRQEAAAVRAIAQHLKIPFHIVETPIFTQVIGGSPLTNTESNAPFAPGEAGAEYAHEWVPARNLIMLSIATGIAESRGFNVLALGANLEEAGCVAADTIVSCRRSGSNHFEWTIKELYEREKLGLHWGVRYDESVETEIRTMLPNGNVEYVPLKRIFKTGIKPVYEIKCEEGYSVRATAEHEFFTMNGWQRTDAIDIGESIYCNGVRYPTMTKKEYKNWRSKMSEAKRGDKNPNKRRENAERIRISCNLKFAAFEKFEFGRMVACGMGFHPYARKLNTIVRARLVVEAAMNKKSYQEWLLICRTNAFDGTEVFLKPEQEVHHKDGNVMNDNLENLFVFESSSHHTLYHHGTLPAPRKVLSVKLSGLQETYDIEVRGTGNYFANRMASHNSFPDNEQAFYDCFSRMLPFAVADGVQLRLVMPVVTKMKHEIVKLGLEINAPMHLTWSCYNDSEKHCGNCGPCFMRKTAFKMNGQEDPVFK